MNLHHEKEAFYDIVWVQEMDTLTKKQYCFNL